jgi:hydroxyacylglutathione hydrolase
MVSLSVSPIAALSDNYIWLLADGDGNALAVDPGEAAPLQAALTSRNLRLRAILLTHHHPDHIGGVAELTGRDPIEVHAPHDERIGMATHRVGDGDRIEIPFPTCQFEVISVPGHTRSHVAFHGHDLLFCGDTLFSVGCGRLFEGTPAQMLESLERLAALPGETRVCCGHEYTLANCTFALTLEPDNAALKARFEQALTARAANRATLPSRLSDELACNPFLRIDAPGIVESLRCEMDDDSDRITRFAALRRLKDSFRA